MIYDYDILNRFELGVVVFAGGHGFNFGMRKLSTLALFDLVRFVHIELNVTIDAHVKSISICP